MGKSDQWRFSQWDGTQNPFGVDPDDLMDRLSEDVFSGWDIDAALRRLMASGWRRSDGVQQPGLDDLMDRLQALRQQQLARYNLGGIFDDARERIDAVLRQERNGIDQRLQAADTESARRILERVAMQRRQQLDALPPDPAAAIKGLSDYEFLDASAEAAFAALLEEMKRSVMDAHVRNLTQNLRTLDGPEQLRMRQALTELNGLLQRYLGGESGLALQRDYDAFRTRWHEFFADAPPTLQEFIAQLQERMAAMESLMRSMTPEQRQQLEEIMAAALDDPELAHQLAELGATLDFLSPQPLGERWSFFGSEGVGLSEAMQVIEQLRSTEGLEAALRGLAGGIPLDAASRAQLAEILGDEAARSADSLQAMVRELEAQGLVETSSDRLELTSRGMRRIGQKALRDLFARLQRDRFGDHETVEAGQGRERSGQTKGYEFGDVFDLDVNATVMNAVRRSGSPRPLSPADFDVHQPESTTRTATVLMLDMSRSMPLRGYFYAAKKVAMALDTLIRSRYPRDTLDIIGFSDYAREIPSAALAQLSVNEYVYGTNLQHALAKARRLLDRHAGANKQIIVISDGEPTAHIEDGRARFFYPPLPETLHRTLVEVQRCTRSGIVINTFMLESNPAMVRFVDEMSRLNRGRVFFISPDRLGDYILVDYLRSRGRAA